VLDELESDPDEPEEPDDPESPEDDESPLPPPPSFLREPRP
jgi:hypothetical protein